MLADAVLVAMLALFLIFGAWLYFSFPRKYPDSDLRLCAKICGTLLLTYGAVSLLMLSFV